MLWPPAVLALLLVTPANPGRTAPAPAPAPAPSPNQPEAIHRQGLAPPPCPLIVPRSTPSLQPLRIQPRQVPLKNALGCLSPADAIYGPDGCPRQVCGSVRGDRVPVPWNGGSPGGAPSQAP